MSNYSPGVGSLRVGSQKKRLLDPETLRLSDFRFSKTLGYKIHKSFPLHKGEITEKNV
jgi:hypothetical protein